MEMRQLVRIAVVLIKVLRPRNLLIRVCLKRYRSLEIFHQWVHFLEKDAGGRLLFEMGRLRKVPKALGKLRRLLDSFVKCYSDESEVHEFLYLGLLFSKNRVEYSTKGAAK